MSKTLHFFIFFLILLLAGGVGYYTVLNSDSLKSQVIGTRYGYDNILVNGQPNPNPVIAMKVIMSQPTQGEAIQFGVEVENPSSGPVDLYGMAFDLEYPDLQKDGEPLISPQEGAPVQRYGVLLFEASDIDPVSRIVSYRGYVGGGASPVVLQAGEKRVVFTFLVRTQPPSEIDQLKLTGFVSIHLAQVAMQDPDASASVLALDLPGQNQPPLQLPVAFYPEGNPDVNFDSFVDNSDVDYLFHQWAPDPADSTSSAQ